MSEEMISKQDVQLSRITIREFGQHRVSSIHLSLVPNQKWAANQAYASTGSLVSVGAEGN
jgi:hypothetical protein